MKAVILCAGYATRLYPLTLNRPKPLLKVAGKEMLSYILEKIDELNAELNKSIVTKAYIVTNSKFYSTFKEWAESKCWAKVPVEVLDDGTKSNETRLGAIGDLDFTIREKNIDDDILLIAGDNLFSFRLSSLYKLAKEKDNSVIAAFDMKDKKKLANKFGVVELGQDSRIVGFEEKPESPKTSLTATCCYMLKKKDLEIVKGFISSEGRPDNIGEMIKYLAKNSEVYACVYDKGWLDIGSREDYEKANREYSA